MHRWAKVSTAVVAACVVAASNASAQNANINVTANVLQAITVSGLQDLAFGNVFPGVPKTIAPSAATSGRFSATGEAGANVNLTFTLPANLVDASLNNLPIGAWTGCHSGTNNAAACSSNFTPSASATPATFIGGQLWVFIGGQVTPAPNQAPGAYSAIATLTLAYF